MVVHRAIVTARMARSLYRKLVPFGSRRDRLLWIAMVTLRKTREGPGPWLRAVKKGIYQLLPTKMQQRILRWTGQDAFYRQRPARHAEADAGVEQTGLVSVVLPVFNQADMVAAAIDSVLAQSYAPFELIVVDDGSTDDVHAVLRRYVGDPRVRVLTQPNQGLPKALSTGFEFAVGEFFTWTSADNVMLPEQLTRLVAFLRERPDVTMVYADYELIDADGQLLEGGEFRVMDRTDKHNLSAVRVNRSTHDLNRYEDNFIGACFLYRGQAGRLIGDYNPELGLEDYDYWMRINRMFRIEHLGTDELLYRYRVHENTLSARARELKIAERAKVLMGYERERAAWFDAPFADAGGDAGKMLCAPSDDELANAPLQRPTGSSLAAWFATPEQVYRQRAWLRMQPLCAFAANADVAARLAVFTRSVFVGERDDDTLELARLHCGNATFFERTRDADKLRRAVPMPLPTAEPLRVLLQIDTFGKGGLERVVLDLAAELRHLGCEVGLLAVDGSALPDGCRAVTLPRRDEQGYARMLDEGRWQIVSAHASTLGAATAAGRGVPFVQVVHNSYVWLERDAIEAYRAADEHTAAYACVSAEALGYSDLRLQLDVTKMLVIENGIEPVVDVPADARTRVRAELGLGEHDFVFLQVASLQPAKAHRVAVHALARARRRHPQAKLVCLGSEMNPVHAAAVRRDVARLGIEAAVVFAGHRDDAASFYAMADAFFLPSFWEGCSLAVYEAMRAGLPLVLSRVGAADEQLLQGHGSGFAPPFDSMFALDASKLDTVVSTVDDDHVEKVADHLCSAITTGAPGGASLPPAAHRATMARRHLLLFGWLLQGGTVPGVRAAIARAANEQPT